MPKYLFILLALIVPVKFQLIGQEVVIDQVVAVVGDNEVLLSDIESQYRQMIDQRVSFDGDAKCQILEELLIQKLLLNQAQIDSIEVSDVEVEMQLNQRLDNYIRMLGSVEELEAAWNKSIVQIKDDFRDDLREVLITNQMRTEILGDTKITPSEVKEFYRKANKDNLPLIEGQIEYYQILKYPPASEEAILEVRERLLGLRERILNGERFSKLAALYSEGPSAPKGGDIGFISRGDVGVDPAYSKAAFALQEGAVSKIVETAFGYHIIQMIERKGDLARTRHIILKPKVSLENAAKARTKLDSVAALIRNDSLTFQQAAVKFSDDENTRMNGGQVVNPMTRNALFEIKDLPQIDYMTLKNLKPGEISEPFETRDERSQKVVYKLVMLKQQIEPHKANLDYDFPLLSQMAIQKKQEKVMYEWLEEKQKSTYIRVNGSFKNCDFRLKGWVK